MTLTRINKIKNYRIFRDLSWPAELHDFGRFNVIYGWNGAGKTTLSSLLRHAEKKEPIREGDIEFMFGDRKITGAVLATETIPSLKVFNRDFVDRAVFEAGSAQFPPVYYFGEDSADQQRRIVELTEQLHTHNVEHGTHSTAARLAGQSLELFCTEEAKGIRLMLTSTGGAYNNYDARNFKQQVQKLSNVDPRPPRLTEAERDVHLNMRESKVLPALQEVSVKFPDLVDLRRRIDVALRLSVLSNRIDDLVNDQALAHWVEHGLELHRNERMSDVCRFCEQPLLAERVQRLEEHFNDQFNRQKRMITSLLADVEQAAAFPKNMAWPPVEAVYQSIQSDYSAALAELQAQSNILKGALDALKRALVAKQEQPFMPMELSSSLKQIGYGEGLGHLVLSLLALVADGAPFVASFAGANALTRINVLIAKHNALTSSFDISIKAAREALANDEVAGALDGWKARSTAVTQAEVARDSTHSNIKKAEVEIAMLEAQVRQHHRPANELSQELAGYLGRSELTFVAEKNGYRMVRGEQPAMNLSDGERTAVAFMYFLKSLQGTDFDLENGIVVIDDPVSSLDANSLFSAFGFMKERTANAKQLFILTHNFSFFRQVRNWFDSVNKRGRQAQRDKPARFFALSPI